MRKEKLGHLKTNGMIKENVAGKKYWMDKVAKSKTSDRRVKSNEG